MFTMQDARGAILGYYVLFKRKSEPEASWKDRTVDRAETTSLVLASLDEYTSYQFAIQAFNCKGVSGRSEIVERKTDEDGELLKQPSSCLEDFCRQSAQNILSYVITNMQPTRNSDSTKSWLFCAFFVVFFFIYLFDNINRVLIPLETISLTVTTIRVKVL